MANAQAGYYKAAQAFALIPYQAILSVAFVLFPLVSRATFEKDMEATRAYVSGALRFALILVVGGAAVFASRPAGVIGLVFPPAYRVAAPALTVLSAGFVAFSLFVVSSTILNGAGKTLAATVAVAVTLAGVVGFNLLLVPGNLGVAGLTATATATTGGMILGCVIAAALVWRTFRALVRPVTLARVAVAAGVAVAVGRYAPAPGKVATLAVAVGVFLLYAVVLVVLRELGRDDLRLLKRIARRG